MCGRYVLAGDVADYVDFFGVDRVVTESLDSNYNVAPTDRVYAVMEREGERLIDSMRWGLIPHWSTNRKQIHINARSETVAAKPVFRDSFSRKRCLIPADGFYEWEAREVGHTPHWIYRADGFPMAFAGLWSSWKDPETEEWINTTTILTTRAGGEIAGIHDRSPLVLDPSTWDPWLDRDLNDASAAEGLIQPVDFALISEHAVDSAVNNVRNNEAALTSPATVQTLF